MKVTQELLCAEIDAAREFSPLCLAAKSSINGWKAVRLFHPQWHRHHVWRVRLWMRGKYGPADSVHRAEPRWVTVQALWWMMNPVHIRGGALPWP